jgi:hypothetical protein
MYEYFQAKYSYSKDDLIQVFGSDFIKFKNSMEDKRLINSNSAAMFKAVDNFMDEMHYNKKRRRN